MSARRGAARRLAGCIAVLGTLLSLAAQAAPGVRIEIEGVERAIADNIRSYLTLTRYAARDDLVDAQVRRLSDRAVNEATDALRPFGYYSPTIRNRTSREDEKSWVVRLKIQPGKQVRLTRADIQITGTGADYPLLAKVRAGSDLKVGAPLDHVAYEKLKADLLRTAREEGYLDAQLERHDMLVDPAQYSAEITVTLATGERYEFGPVEIEQEAIDRALLEGFVRFAPGQPYRPAQIRATQFALEDSGYFENVTVAQGEIDRVNHVVPMVISGETVKRHRYSLRLGYGTDTGIRGKFTWDNRLVNDRGHRWAFETTLSEVQQNALVRYLIPVGDPTLEKLEFLTGFTNEDIGDLESERFEVAGGLTQVLDQWQRVLFLRLIQERTIFPGGDDQTDLLLIPGISYSTLPPNFLTGWVREASYYLELSGSPETLGSDASYLRFLSRVERVWRLGDGPWHLRSRGELGVSWVNDFSELPASQRFFAGGDRSVRGYPLNDLSPEACETDPVDGSQTNCKKIGGEHKVVATLELERDLPRDLRGAVFVDVGNAFEDWSDPGFEYSIGIGVRYRLPMLLIGLDVAQSLSESDRRPRLHLNITQVL
jgi:translocation and assembly module TamA